MNFEYKILWIDDQTHDIKFRIKSVAQFLNSQGLVPDIVEANTPDDIAARVRNLDNASGMFDLVVVDYKLAAENGADIARKIRAKCVTDVIFYSSSDRKTLLAELHKRELDGVFVSSRSDIGSRVMDVISSHLRWALDINTMRGLATSSVTEIDHLIEKIIRFSARFLTEGEKEIVGELREFIREVEQAQRAGAPSVDAILTLDEMLLHPQFGSRARFMFLKKLWTRFPDRPAISELREALEQYDRKVLEFRNALAHGKAIGDELRHKNKKVTRDELRELRIAIRDHGTAFVQLAELLRTIEA